MGFYDEIDPFKNNLNFINYTNARFIYCNDVELRGNNNTVIHYKYNTRYDGDFLASLEPALLCYEFNIPT